MLTGKLANAEPLIVLENGSHLVVGNDLIKELTVDVVALQGLAVLSSAEDVAAGAQPSVHQGDSGRVLKVSKREAGLDVLCIVYELVDEEVGEGLVERHQNHLVIL